MSVTKELIENVEAIEKEAAVLNQRLMGLIANLGIAGVDPQHAVAAAIRSGGVGIAILELKEDLYEQEAVQ